MGFGQGVIQAGAFFQFRFIERYGIGNELGGGTTFGAHGFDLKGGLRNTPDRQNHFTLINSHARNIARRSRCVIRKGADFRLGVCLTWLSAPRKRETIPGTFFEVGPLRGVTPKRDSLARFFVPVFILISAAVPISYAQTLWTGPSTNYMHTSGDAADPLTAANTDQITLGVWITRAGPDAAGIFNAVTQTSYGSSHSEGSGTPDGSPSDTEWAVGTVSSVSDAMNLTYSYWFDTLHGADGVNQQAVVHLISEDIYIPIEFTAFSSDGTYSYTRGTPPAAAVAPTVTITNPAPGSVFAAPATFEVAASASVTGGTVTNVNFFTNGTLAGFSTSAPYEITLSGVHVGAYSLTAVATASGISATSAVVNISVVPPPSVTVTNPANGAVFAVPANVKLGASATVVMGSVTNVSFFNGNALVGSATAAPFSATANNVSTGSYAFTAVATAAGLSRTSAVVNISVVNPVPVVLSSPDVSGGQFSFDYTANTGLTYVVESSSNLLNWVPLSTNIATNTPVMFEDNSGLANQRFYDVILLPNP